MPSIVLKDGNSSTSFRLRLYNHAQGLQLSFYHLLFFIAETSGHRRVCVLCKTSNKKYVSYALIIIISLPFILLFNFVNSLRLVCTFIQCQWVTAAANNTSFFSWKIVQGLFGRGIFYKLLDIARIGGGMFPRRLELTIRHGLASSFGIFL
jgi:hypothetical protein